MGAFVSAWERQDASALLAVLTEDVRFSMPPLPAWYASAVDVGRFFAERVFATPWRLRRSGRTVRPALPATSGSPSKLIVSNIMSLDGYYEGPGGNVMALPMDARFDAYNLERLQAADTLLLGARTYRLFKGFWPSMRDNPDASPTHREIGRLDDVLTKVVVSDTLSADETDPWAATTRIVRRGQAHREIAALKNSPGRDILVFGSHTLWNDLLGAGLVDELHLMIGAVVLGGGTPAFTQPPRSSLRLLGARSWEGSSNALLTYAAGA